jgi:MOSC domain-containing protein YiiM
MSSEPAGQVVTIHIARRDGDPVELMPAVRVLKGRGIEGDRYFDRTNNVTLVQEEYLKAACADIGAPHVPGASRRNITVRGIELNPLVGQSFRVGSVLLEGYELAEPCGIMEKAIGKGARNALVHKGGLRAWVLSDGEIRPSDPIMPEASSATETGSSS